MHPKLLATVSRTRPDANDPDILWCRVGDNEFPLLKKERYADLESRTHISGGILARDHTITLLGSTVHLDSQIDWAYDPAYSISFWDDTVQNLNLSQDASFLIKGTEFVFKAHSHAFDRDYGGFFDLSFYSNGMVRKGHLAQDAIVTISGTPVVIAADSFVSFFKNGGLKEGRVRDTTPITIGANQICIKKKGSVDLYENGALRSGSVVEPATITIGKNTLLFFGLFLEFYGSGTLLCGELYQPQQVAHGTATLSLFTYEKITFYPDGKLRSIEGLQASFEYSIGGQRFSFAAMYPAHKDRAREKEISFHRNGKVHLAALSHYPVQILGQSVLVHGDVEFNACGQLLAVDLGEDAIIRGEQFRAGDRVELAQFGPVPEDDIEHRYISRGNLSEE